MTRNSILLLFGLLVALAPKALLADDAHDDGDGENECPGTDLVCLHNTTCIEGEANFTWHPVRPGVGDKFDFSKETSRHGFHCDCPLGLTGLRCGRTYESCNDGDHTCFNGGKCIDKLKDIYQNEQLFCDCPASADEDGNTVFYSGKYCEVELDNIAVSRCTEDNNICLNGGTCKKNVDELDPCDCPEDYMGRLCEYPKDTVPDCDLTCMNHGACRLGTKEENHDLTLQQPNGEETTTNLKVVHEGYQYCECPSGYTGVRCETQNTVCGDIVCRHGSTCISVEDQNSGQISNHCDCHVSNKDRLANGEDLQYAGRHCEVPSTKVCHFPDSKTTFCTNDGLCPEAPNEDCICKEGLTGAHCEFEDEDADLDHVSCGLKCMNDGVCRKGTIQDENTQDLIRQYGGELSHMALNVSHNEDFEHCACKDGYVGLQCEYSMTSCGEDGKDHPCFHGSKCTMVNNIPTCVCEDADTQVAGFYCQHLAQDVCTPGLDPPEDDDANSGGLLENRGFCVNEGVCVTNKDGEAACRCHSQYEGPHCEFSTGTNHAAIVAKAKASGQDSSGLSGGGKFGVFFAVMVCVGAIVFGIVQYRRLRVPIDQDCAPSYPDLDNTLAMDDQSRRSAPVVDVGPEKDWDGNELKDVEFI